MYRICTVPYQRPNRREKRDRKNEWGRCTRTKKNLKNLENSKAKRRGAAYLCAAPSPKILHYFFTPLLHF